MKIERRRFLEQVASACTVALGRNLLTTAAVPATAAAAASVAPAVAATVAQAADTLSAGTYGHGVRRQVFEVVVRQGVAGVPWREICAGPMKGEADVEAEIKRRVELIEHTGKANCACKRCRVVHKDSLACDCVKCSDSKEVRARFIGDRLPAVAHSQQAPCACIACRQTVDEFLRGVFALSKQV